MIHTVIYSSYFYNPFSSYYNSFLRSQLTYFVTLKHLNFLIIYQEIIHPSCYFISLFHISQTPSISTPDFCRHFKILIISSKSLFKLTKLILFLLLKHVFQAFFFEQNHLLQKLMPQQLMKPNNFSQRNSNLHHWKSNFVKQSSKKSSSLNNFRQIRFTKFYARRHIVSKSICYFVFLSCCQ